MNQLVLFSGHSGNNSTVDKVFVPPQPMSIPDLKKRITAAVETITPDLLIRVWQELDYRLDVCRVTKGAYIEHL
jgi:hypothetical protein